MVKNKDTTPPRQLPPIYVVLRELASRESGVGFIYAALNVLNERYGLSDVAIVLESSAISTRVFRLDGRDVDTSTVAALGASPGVYCLPDIVPERELEAIYIACQEAYTYRFVRNIPDGEQAESSEAVRTPAEAVSLDTTLSDEPTTPKRVRQVTRREPSTRAMAVRAMISRLLLGIDVAALVLTAMGIHGPLRLVLGLVLGIVIPGWCIVAPLKLDNGALEFGLVLTVSLSLLMMVAQILMTLGLWHLVALEEITCALCLPFLLNQARLATLWSPNATSRVPGRTKAPSAT
jgi:hypothetical protein